MFPQIPISRTISKTLAVMTAVAALVCVPACAQQIPSETWMGIYLGNAKIGYARFSVDKATFKGKEGYKLDSTSVTKVIALGEQIEQNMDTTIYLNKKFEPVYQLFDMSSGGHSTRITAKFSAKEVLAEVEAEGSRNTKTIPIPKGTKLVGDTTFFPATMKLKVGDKMTVKCFNPLSLSLDDLQVEVQRKEQLKLDDKTYDTYVIRNLTPLGDMICWQDENGDLLKVTMIMGLMMVRETAEVAQNLGGVYSPPADLAVMTSAPTSTDVPNARQVKYMKVRLVGLEAKSLALGDYRQKVVYTPGDKPSAEYEITSSDFPADKATPLPISGAEFTRYLAESPYVQPKDPEISKTALDIIGTDKNSYTAVSRVRTWVHTNMQSKGNIGIVRSSVDVLHAKTGVCRDYAVLYTALARAAGIPTKLVAGLVYWKGGFYYHAWAESYVGEWIPVDPTLPMDFVDATHIKMAEGDATAMFDMVKTMGTLKAEILEFK